MSGYVAGDRFDFRVAVPPMPSWRALDAALARWVRAHGGSRALSELAGWASLADGQGDSALPLNGRHGMPAVSAATQATLAQEALVADAAAGAPAPGVPFVLDAGHFYLRRNWLLECQVAGHLASRCHGGDPLAPAPDAATLATLFGAHADAADAEQRRAVTAVLGQRLFVLTGGPGTGKTRTVLRMLLLLARAHAERHGRMPRLGIAAPTGKAAQRLGAALAAGGDELAELAADLRTALAAIRAEPARTVHRLLGSRGRAGGFRQHAGNPLEADIVVIDEASMLDLALLRAVLAALRPDALLVLVGDADQLTSVGTGSVLLDLVAAIGEAGAQPQVVRLRHCFRADRALVPILEAVRDGDAEAFARHWQAASAAARVQRHATRTRAQLATRLDAWAAHLREAFAAAGAFAPIAADDRAGIARALRVLDTRQLLCALREGEFGAERLAERLDRQMRRCSGSDETQLWYPGRAVMVVRNDPASGLFNGDVGLCLRTDSADETALSVCFPPSAGMPEVRRFAIASLPPTVAAFALTVHKSQGSEYDQVAVLLPVAADSPLLNRQLLYTALSRARHGLELWAGDDAIAQALATPIARAGLLRQRLLGGCAQDRA